VWNSFSCGANSRPYENTTNRIRRSALSVHSANTPNHATELVGTEICCCWHAQFYFVEHNRSSCSSLLSKSWQNTGKAKGLYLNGIQEAWPGPLSILSFNFAVELFQHYDKKTAHWFSKTCKKFQNDRAINKITLVIRYTFCVILQYLNVEHQAHAYFQMCENCCGLTFAKLNNAKRFAQSDRLENNYM